MGEAEVREKTRESPSWSATRLRARRERAHREALRFFALPDDIKQQCSRHMVLRTVGPEQILIGHSKPTNAKELLRVYDALLCPL